MIDPVVRYVEVYPIATRPGWFGVALYPAALGGERRVEEVYGPYPSETLARTKATMVSNDKKAKVVIVT
jgi:hypothetical protein